MPIDLTKDTFEKTVTENAIVLVDFWASWCGPCRQFAPVFEASATANPDLVFGKVDTEAEQELAGMAGITSIPTLMIFRDGILVFSQPGALPAPALEELISQVRTLDMDDIRRQLAEAESMPDDEVDIDALAAAHAAGGFVLDVREPDEYAAGHVPGAVLVPKDQVASRLSEIPRDQPVYVICRSGRRSRDIVDAIRPQGFDAINVAGGTLAWIERGWPTE